MTIPEFVAQQDISKVIHFTTGDGLLGILGSKAVLPRVQLEDNKLLEFILQLNAEVRRDSAWLDYVNMSISRINSYYFEYSQNHHNVRWYVLNFSPDILSHDDVVFTTTNNIYKGVSRSEGIDGLKSAFASSVTHEKGTFYRFDTPSNCPTCNQAEVLYPGRLNLQHLNTVYARSEEEAKVPRAQLRTLGYPQIDLVIDPTIFA